MYYIIYKITNNINGKFYIGKHKTSNLDDGYFGSGKMLKRAISKYGVENFTKDIIEIYNSEDKMNLAEKILVVTDQEVSYNLCLGGYGGFEYINKLENKKYWVKKGGEVLKKRKIGLCFDPNLFGKFSGSKEDMKSMSIKALSEYSKTKRKETFKKIKHQQGENNSQYRTCWITNGKITKKIKKTKLTLWLNKGYINKRVWGNW